MALTPRKPRDARFWNRLAKRYAAMPVRDSASYREKLTRTRAVLPDQARLLEIGCGTGSTALAHAPHAADILAIDFSESMIAIARQKAAAEGITNVAFRTAALEDITDADGTFDAVLALNVVHLLRDPPAAIAQMITHLRPGGVLVLSTPCLGDNMYWMRPLAVMLTTAGAFPTLSFFTRDTLETWLTDAGLTIEDNWQPAGAGKAVFHIARRAGASPAPDV